jgi:Fic family protein
MEPAQFSDSAPGRLVRSRHEGIEHWAFVPNPLPPALEVDPALAGAVAGAHGALGELKGLGRMLLNPHLLIRPFVRREAVLSSRIEGTQASLGDVYVYEAGQLALPGISTGAPASDIQEVINYVHALDYGLQRVETLPVSRRFISELHRLLLTGVRGERARPGEFRHRQNWIGPPECSVDQATYVPPPVPEMDAALDAFERYVHATDVYPPLIRLAFIHYQFEAIHPFIDGNGRIGRLLMSLLLVHWDLLTLPLLYLSAFFERHRDRYLDLLRAVSERGAWREWVAFFLQGVEEQARDAADRVARLQDLQRDWRDRVTRKRSSPLLPRLVDSLFEAPIVTIPDAQKRLGDVNYRTAQLNIEKLVEEGILRSAGNPRYGRSFVADQVLRVVEDVRPTSSELQKNAENYNSFQDTCT